MCKACVTIPVLHVLLIATNVYYVNKMAIVVLLFAFRCLLISFVVPCIWPIKIANPVRGYCTLQFQIANLIQITSFPRLPTIQTLNWRQGKWTTGAAAQPFLSWPIAHHWPAADWDRGRQFAALKASQSRWLSAGAGSGWGQLPDYTAPCLSACGWAGARACVNIFPWKEGRGVCVASLWFMAMHYGQEPFKSQTESALWPQHLCQPKTPIKTIQFSKNTFRTNHVLA